MPSVADKIMKRVTEQDSRSWVCTPKDFLDLGSREAVDQALSRLVKAGRLRRIGTGLYDTPRTSNVLKRSAPVDMDAAIVAIARRDALRILPDGLAAANQLGLTNEAEHRAGVPSEPEFWLPRFCQVFILLDFFQLLLDIETGKHC